MTHNSMQTVVKCQTPVAWKVSNLINTAAFLACEIMAAFQTHKRHTLLHLPSHCGLEGIPAAIFAVLPNNYPTREVGHF
jgi:hypothetical protein